MEVFNETSKKLLLISPTNTGSTSRLEACKQFMGHNCKGNMDRFCVVKKHASLNDLNNTIELDGYYIAIIVRNPYERVMSNFIRRFIRHDKMKEEIVFKQLEKYMNKQEYKKLPNQSDLLKIKRKYQKINKIGYYENLEEDWKTICEECNLPVEKLKILKPMEMDSNILNYIKTNYERNMKYRFEQRNKYNYFLDLNARKEIYEYFKEDFDNFDYDPDL